RAFEARQRSPFALECRPGRGDRAVDISVTGVGDACPRLTGVGIDGVVEPAVRRRTALAPDVELVLNGGHGARPNGTRCYWCQSARRVIRNRPPKSLYDSRRISLAARSLRSRRGTPVPSSRSDVSSPSRNRPCGPICTLMSALSESTGPLVAKLCQPARLPSEYAIRRCR